MNIEEFSLLKRLVELNKKGRISIYDFESNREFVDIISRSKKITGEPALKCGECGWSGYHHNLDKRNDVGLCRTLHCPQCGLMRTVDNY